MAEPVSAPFKAIGNFLMPPKPPVAAMPSQTPAPPLPTVDDAETKARMAAAEQNERNRKKRTRTILTGAQGVLDQAPVQIKSLLGQ